MSTDPHTSDIPGHAGAVEHHATNDHGEDHGHDDHGHESGALGPIDTQAWGAFVVGLALGLAVAVSVALAVGGIPA